MKLPCSKAEWPRNLPICGGDCHSMERTSQREPVEQLLLAWIAPSSAPGHLTGCCTITSTRCNCKIKKKKKLVLCSGETSIGYCLHLKILSQRLVESDEYFLAVNMSCFVILLKLKVRETDLTMFFPLCPLVSVPRAPVYVGSVLCGIGGNHSLLRSVFGKVESLGQLRGTKMCCSIEVHHIFSNVTDRHL